MQKVVTPALATPCLGDVGCGSKTVRLSLSIKGPFSTLKQTPMQNVKSTTGAVAKSDGEWPLPAMPVPQSSVIAPFPVAARRTVRADFPHTALGQDITLSPTEGCA